jgi:hypothetical protein
MAMATGIPCQDSELLLVPLCFCDYAYNETMNIPSVFRKCEKQYENEIQE